MPNDYEPCPTTWPDGTPCREPADHTGACMPKTDDRPRVAIRSGAIVYSAPAPITGADFIDRMQAAVPNAFEDLGSVLADRPDIEASLAAGAALDGLYGDEWEREMADLRAQELDDALGDWGCTAQGEAAR